MEYMNYSPDLVVIANKIENGYIHYSLDLVVMASVDQVVIAIKIEMDTYITLMTMNE